MKAFKISVVIFALIPLLTGIGDVLLGVSAWKGLGVNLSDRGFLDSVLDSQVRFMATIWFGYGVLLCACLRDLDRYANILRGALAFAFIGGIARVISIVHVGMPNTEVGSNFLIFAIVIEFVAIPALLIWQHKLMGDKLKRRTID